MFRALDVDRSMSLTEEDFRCLQDSQKDLVLRSAFHDMRNAMDQDNDGIISEAEFFAYFVVAALFGGFQFIGGMPTSPLSLDSKRNIGEQMIQVHLNFYSHFESHVSKFEVILKQQGLIH